MVRSKSLVNAADAASGGRGTHCYQWKIGGQCFVPYPCRVLVRVDSVNIHNIEQGQRHFGIFTLGCIQRDRRLQTVSGI